MEQSEQVFKEFLDLCRVVTDNDTVVINLLQRHYSHTNPHYLWSEDFRSLVGTYSDRIRADPANKYVHIREIVIELKAYRAKPLKHLIQSNGNSPVSGRTPNGTPPLKRLKTDADVKEETTCTTTQLSGAVRRAPLISVATPALCRLIPLSVIQSRAAANESTGADCRVFDVSVDSNDFDSLTAVDNCRSSEDLKTSLFASLHLAQLDSHVASSSVNEVNEPVGQSSEQRGEQTTERAEPASEQRGEQTTERAEPVDEPVAGTSGVQDSESNVGRGSHRQVMRLEKLLERINAEIRKLEEKELSLEEMDKEDSSYLLVECYKKRFVKVWNKLCEVKGRSVSTGREVEKLVKYTGSKYVQINQMISHFINKYRVFPDYHDVHDIIVRCNRKHDLKIKKCFTDSLARDIFTDVGNLLQQKRIKDFVGNFGCHLTENFRTRDDPATFDKELRQKLETNHKEGRHKLEQVISKFVERQEDPSAGGVASDSDESSAEHDSSSDIELDIDTDIKDVVQLTTDDTASKLPVNTTTAAADSPIEFKSSDDDDAEESHVDDATNSQEDEDESSGDDDRNLDDDNDELAKCLVDNSVERNVIVDSPSGVESIDSSHAVDELGLSSSSHRDTTQVDGKVSTVAVTSSPPRVPSVITTSPRVPSVITSSVMSPPSKPRDNCTAAVADSSSDINSINQPIVSQSNCSDEDDIQCLDDLDVTSCPARCSTNVSPPPASVEIIDDSDMEIESLELELLKQRVLKAWNSPTKESAIKSVITQACSAISSRKILPPAPTQPTISGNQPADSSSSGISAAEKPSVGKPRIVGHILHMGSNSFLPGWQSARGPAVPVPRDTPQLLPGPQAAARFVAQSRRPCRSRPWGPHFGARSQGPMPLPQHGCDPTQLRRTGVHPNSVLSDVQQIGATGPQQPIGVRSSRPFARRRFRRQPPNLSSLRPEDLYQISSHIVSEIWRENHPETAEKGSGVADKTTTASTATAAVDMVSVVDIADDDDVVCDVPAAAADVDVRCSSVVETLSRAQSPLTSSQESVRILDDDSNDVMVCDPGTQSSIVSQITGSASTRHFTTLDNLVLPSSPHPPPSLYHHPAAVARSLDFSDIDDVVVCEEVDQPAAGVAAHSPFLPTGGVTRELQSTLEGPGAEHGDDVVVMNPAPLRAAHSASPPSLSSSSTHRRRVERDLVLVDLYDNNRSLMSEPQRRSQSAETSCGEAARHSLQHAATRKHSKPPQSTHLVSDFETRCADISSGDDVVICDDEPSTSAASRSTDSIQTPRNVSVTHDASRFQRSTIGDLCSPSKKLLLISPPKATPTSSSRLFQANPPRAQVGSGSRLRRSDELSGLHQSRRSGASNSSNLLIGSCRSLAVESTETLNTSSDDDMIIAGNSNADTREHREAVPQLPDLEPTDSVIILD